MSSDLRPGTVTWKREPNGDYAASNGWKILKAHGMWGGVKWVPVTPGGMERPLEFTLAEAKAVAES